MLNVLVNKYNKNTVAGNVELVSGFGPYGDSFVLFVCSLVFTAGLESDFFRYLLSTYQLISSLGFWWIQDSK